MDGMLIVLFLFIFSIFGKIFHVNPSLGNINNPGTITSPLSTFSEILSSGLIESFEPSSLPYNNDESKLIVKNEGGMIKGGDTLLLYNGIHHHGGMNPLEFVNYYNEEMIYVKAAEGEKPQLGMMIVRSCRNWMFEGLEISPEIVGSTSQRTIFTVENHGHSGNCDHIIIENCTIYTTKDTSSWTMDDWDTKSCSGIELNGIHNIAKGNNLYNVDHGIYGSGGYNQIIGNKINYFSKDGLRGNSNHMLFEGNIIMNNLKVNGNHDVSYFLLMLNFGKDCFQSFTGSSGNDIVNITLRKNVFLSNEDPGRPFGGALQGIGAFDGFYDSWLIEDNLIVVDHYNSITLSGARKTTIRHNTAVQPVLSSERKPWIKISNHKDGRGGSKNYLQNNIQTHHNWGCSGCKNDINDDNLIVVVEDYDPYYLNTGNIMWKYKIKYPLLINLY